MIKIVFHIIDYISKMVYICIQFNLSLIMNKIRKRWKNNGTPFYFRFCFDGIYYAIYAETCKYLDSIEFENGLTCMDILVDIHYIVMKLQQVSSTLLYDSVKFELYTLLDLVIKRANLSSIRKNPTSYVFESPKNS